MIEITNKSKIGTILKNLIKQKGHDSKEIAYATGVTPQTISKVLKADLNVKLSTVIKILDSIGFKIVIIPKKNSIEDPVAKIKGQDSAEFIKQLSLIKSELNNIFKEAEEKEKERIYALYSLGSKE